jgi:hypothetical protein
MTTENELRQAMAAEAESMKWSLSLHDVTTGEVVDSVVSLDDVRRRRTPMVLGAAVAVALIGGGAYLATHRNANEGRVLAGGRAASKIGTSSAAATSSDVMSAGFVPGGPVSLAGMTLVLPMDLPKNYRLQSVFAMPVGSNNGAPPGLSIHMLILKGATAAELMTVNATKFSGNVTMATSAPNTGQGLKVHGVDAQLFNGDPVKNLNWTEGGVQYSVSASATMSDSEVVKLAESVVPVDGSTASFTATTPPGYAVSYDGDGNVQPAWSYNLQYSRENLDKPYDDNIGIEVRPAGSEQLDALQALGMAGAASKPVKVGGLDATLTTMEPGGPAANSSERLVSTSLMWKTADGLTISLNSQGVSEAELLSFAESITTVDEATFRATVGERLQSNGGWLQSDFTAPDVITFTGTTDGHAWTVRVTPPGPVDSPNANCVQFSFDGSGGSGESCGSGPTDDSLTQLSSSGETGGAFAYGVVSNKIRKVVVRDADTKNDIISVDAIAGTGGDDRRLYVISMKPLAKDVKNFMLVGLDDKGEIVGTPTPQPAAAYPGNFGDTSVPAMPEMTAPPATIYVPGAPSVQDASDPTKLPVFAAGTLDGRPWELRKPTGLTSDGPTCWYFSFAAGIPQMSCGGTADPKMNLVVVHDRRTFVLVGTAADITKVKATFKDGRVEEVVPTVKGTERVAVIGVGLNDVLVAVTAVNADGTDTTSSSGMLPGDPSLPFSFGGESGSNGSFSRSVETTIAPAYVPTTAKP